MPQPASEDNRPAEDAGRRQTPPDKAVPAARRSWKKVILRWVGLCIVGYLVPLVGAAVFQRSLIYQPTRFARIDPRQAGFPEGCVHDIALSTEDGLTLHGWHFLPEGQACKTVTECDAALASAKWLFLFFHGNGGSRIDRALDCRSLAGREADVFIFDYRGYGENPGLPSEADFARDAQSAWNYATRTRHVPADRIVLYGESLGGGVAVRLASELCAAGTPPAGMILVGTFSSLTDAAGYHYPWLPVKLLLMDRYSSVDRAPLVTCPVLQIHGGRDDIVPIELGRRLFSAFPTTSARGVANRFAEIATAGHNDLAENLFQPLVDSFLDGLK